MDTETPLPEKMTDAERASYYERSKAAFEGLMAFQWASPEKIAVHQENSAKRLVAHTLEHVPFYRDRLAMLRAPDGSADLERWLEVPTLQRADVVANREELRAKHVPSDHGGTRGSRSSGSTTGERVEVLMTERQDSIGASAQFRFWNACGLNYRNNLGMIRAADPNAGIGMPPAPDADIWGPPWLPAGERGRKEMMSVHTPLPRQVAWLAERTPVYLHTNPSNLLALAHYVRDGGSKPSGIAGAITGGEVLTDDIRAQARRWLGLDMFDSLANAECGVMAAQCQDGDGGYHTDAEVAVVEVVKPDGSPCRPGETGRLTVTPLHAYAMPLIRYQTDDWVTVGQMCSCGRNLPVIGRILGRDRELFRLGGEVPVRLEPESDVVFGHIGPRRWQIAQLESDRFEIRIAEARLEKPADTEAMAAYVGDLLDRDVDVACKLVPVLGAQPGGKFMRTIREFG